MRHRPALVVHAIVFALAMGWAAPTALAQVRGDNAQATVSDETQPARDDADRAPPQPRSAFGRVMSVMISALVQDSRRRRDAAAPSAAASTVDADAGLPVDVELRGASAPLAGAARPSHRADVSRASPELAGANPAATQPVESGELPPSSEPLALQAVAP